MPLPAEGVQRFYAVFPCSTSDISQLECPLEITLTYKTLFLILEHKQTCVLIIIFLRVGPAPAKEFS